MKRRIGYVISVMMLFLLFWPATAASATDALSGKTALFLGDSIAAGWRDEINGDRTNAGGWSKRIGDTYGMPTTLAAIAGNSFTPMAKRGRIVDQVKKKAGCSYDYVILQGGFNDAMGENKKPANPATSAPVGEMAQGFTLAEFDTATYGGALEETLYYIKQYFPTARVGYIITYATPNSEYGGCTADAADMLRYYDLGKQICQKWGVACLDLFSGKTDDGRSYSYDILQVDKDVNFPGGSDHIHLNSHGYDTIYPYIAQWMTTIQPMGSTTTTTTTTTIESDLASPVLNEPEVSVGDSGLSATEQAGRMALVGAVLVFGILAAVLWLRKKGVL